jgi:hypothetical protein
VLFLSTDNFSVVLFVAVHTTHSKKVTVLASYLNHCLGDNKMLVEANLIPLDPNSSELIHKVSPCLYL